jgi:hypothetical protein
MCSAFVLMDMCGAWHVLLLKELVGRTTIVQSAEMNTG